MSSSSAPGSRSAENVFPMSTGQDQRESGRQCTRQSGVVASASPGTFLAPGTGAVQIGSLPPHSGVPAMGGGEKLSPVRRRCDTSVKSRKRLLRRIGAVALLLWTLVVLCAGVAGGWLIHDRLQAGKLMEGPSVIEIPALEAVPEFAMPDLRGLTLGEAKQVIVDSGAKADAIDVTEVEWGGQPGLVIGQNPVVGEKVVARIGLQVSKQATMPGILGLSELEAVDRLKSLGAEAVVEERFDLAARTGTVLEVDIHEGQTLPKVVKMVVAQPGAALFLAQLAPVGGGCVPGDARINGQAYLNSVKCGSGSVGYPSNNVWLLDRKAHQLSGVIGVDDRGHSDAVAQVTIIGDGKELASVSAAYAQPAKVDVTVKDVLRLEMIVTSQQRVNAVLGDMLVKGLPEQISSLEKRR